MTTTNQSIGIIPTHFPVAVIMQRSPPLNSAWCDYQWSAIGIAVTANENAQSNEARLVHENGDTRQYMYSGFNIRLHIDECESYYQNLMSPTPRCYVVASRDDNDTPEPFLVCMSFDEAHAYLEGDEEVYDVDIPPELYCWTEAFVLTHYAPEKRLKRKRQNWKNPKQESLTS